MPRKIAVYDSKSFEGITDIMAKHPKAHIHGIVRAPPVLLSRKLNQSRMIWLYSKNASLRKRLSQITPLSVNASLRKCLPVVNDLISLHFLKKIH